MRSERDAWRGVPLMAAILIALGFGFGAWQAAARRAGVRTPLETFVSLAISPIRGATVATLDATGDFGRGVFAGGRLQRENALLRARLESLAMYDETVRRLEQEVDGFRRLNGMAALAGRGRILADLRGFSPLESRITVGAGSKEGVRKGMAVVAPAGLLAMIESVGPHESSALLITAASSTVGGIAPAHDPPPAGLVRGESAATLLLTFADPNAPVALGDAIVTTGYSEFVPRGVPIGRVIQVEDAPELGARTARIYPAAQIGRVREVAILK